MALVAAEPGDLPAMTRLVRAALRLLDADGAAVVVMRDGGDTQVIADAGVGAAPLAESQFQLGVGPALDAHRTGEAVSSADLGNGVDARWPTLSAHAGFDVHAVLAIPIRVGAVRLGVLAVHRDHPTPWTHEEELDAATISDLLASVVLDDLAGLARRELTGVPQHAVVHQATGMVAAQLEIGLVDALARLRARAFTEDRPLYDVSVDVVTRVVRLES